MDFFIGVMRKIKFILGLLVVCCSTNLYAQNDTIKVYSIDEVSVVSFFNGNNKTTEYKKDELVQLNYGQEPSNLFAKMPSIISLNDNGTEFGYGYFRIRGLDQTRINVMLDGCPWNEAEDFGTYFANSPDLMTSMENISVQRGTSSTNNGVAGSAGNINMESINIWNDNESYAHFGFGSYGSYKTSVIYNMKPNNGWGLHIKATHQQTDGYRDNSSNKSKALTFKTGYKFNDKHSLDILSMNGFHKNGQGWIGNTLEELAINPHANGNTRREDDMWLMSMNRIQYKGWLTNNFILTSSAYYQYQTGSYRMDWNNYASKFDPKNVSADYVLYDYGLTHNLTGANVIGKLYLNNLVLNAGVNAYHYNRRHYNGEKGINDEEYDNTGYKNDLNGFVVLSYSPINNLTIGGNIQYRHVTFDYKDRLNSEMSFTPETYGTKWDFINWGLNVDYNINQRTKLYAKYSQVNREPTRSDMFGGYEYLIDKPNTLTAEVANDFELGIDIRGEKVTANINFYYMWFKNELILNGEYNKNGLPCHENADESVRSGFEATVNWNICNNVYFDFNGSYAHSQVITKTFGKGIHVLTPKYTVDFDLYWKNSMWRVGANVNKRSSMFVDMENTPQFAVPEALTFNVYGFVKLKNVELGLRCNNITNRVNYCTGMVNAFNQVLYTRNAGFNVHGSVNIFF